MHAKRADVMRDGNLYAACWAPGDGEQIPEAPGGLNVYFGQPRDFLVYKYENRGLHVHAMGHNGYAVAVYRPKPYRETRGWYIGPAAQFGLRDATYRRDGYRLSFISHASWQIG